MAGGVDERPCVDGRKQVSECIPLLQHPREDATSRSWAVLKCSGDGIPVKPTHGNAEKGVTHEERLVGVGETRCQLQDDKEDIVENKRPLSSVSVGEETENNGTNGAKHQDQCDAPCDFGICLAKLLRQRLHG